MKLFKLQISKGKKGREILAYAESVYQARGLVAGKFTGWTIDEAIELPERPAYFTLAELEPDA